ncbi:MAG: DUF5050 domain-containing protein [Clostridia bacterium]|nr:DUF5050 domain-containing protein [Clostridia bacterium]
MKYKLLTFIALLTATVLLLTGCQPKNNSEDPAAEIASYSGYSNIPDYGNLSGAKSDETLAKAAAARLNVDPETVLAYPLDESSAAFIDTWQQELDARGFVSSADLEEGGNTVTWYSEDRDIGVVTGYMDTDQKDGMDALVVMLVGKDAQEQYLNIDYETVQETWSNANNGASHYIDEKKIYGFGYVGSSYEGFLAKNTDSSDPVLLVEDVKPKFVQEVDKTVYAYLPGHIVSYDTKEKDPEEAVTTLLDVKAKSLQYYNDKLYYTTKNGLFQAEPDGTDAVKLTGKAMENAYLVGDKVYYRDKEDNNTEHVYSLLTEADTRITEESVSSFFLGSKGYAYYITEREVTAEEPEEDAEEAATETASDEETSEETAAEEETTEASEEEPETAFMLVRMALKNGETTELATVLEGTGLVGIDGKVYFVSDEHNGQIYSVSKSGSTPKRVTRDEDCRNLMTFHDMIVYYDYDDETAEGLEHIYISTTDGFMKSDILN